MGKDNGGTAATSFWDYSLSIYGRQAVRDRCLALQDNHQADVNILLFLCWRATQGAAAPSDAVLADVVKAAEPVKLLAVLPLRDLRQTLRSPIPDDVPALREMLRQRVLEAEIAAEALVQSILERRFPPEEAQASPREAGAEALSRYLTMIGMGADEAGAEAAALAAEATDP